MTNAFDRYLQKSGNGSNPEGDIPPPLQDSNRTSPLEQTMYQQGGEEGMGLNPSQEVPRNAFDRYLQKSQPEKQDSSPIVSGIKKGARIAGQGALGAASRILFPFEAAQSPLQSPKAQLPQFREEIFEEIQDIQQRKSNNQSTPEDEQRLEYFTELIKNPRASLKQLEGVDLSATNLVSKALGTDLRPEGIAEKAANWIGFIKKPQNLLQLKNSGFSTKELIKNILPDAGELASGIGAGTALQLAEDGDLGPIGTISAAIVGDLAGRGLVGGVKSAAKLITQPKQQLAKAVAEFTPTAKRKIQSDLIDAFNEAGIQADAGTITDSNLIRTLQTRIAQSGLVGKDLKEFVQSQSNEIKSKYQELADSLGKAKYLNRADASEALKEAVTRNRDADKAVIDKLYDESRRLSAGQEAVVKPSNVLKTVNRLEESLSPGALKGTEQKSVLNYLKELKGDLVNSKGEVKEVAVRNLLNDKIALGDIINYEVQGGQKKLLKELVRDLDDSIRQYGATNKDFRTAYNNANKSFARHADIFRNDRVNKILTTQNPTELFNEMNTVQGIRDIKRALLVKPEGKNTFDSLARAKLEQVIGDKMVSNTSEQIKKGTFSNLLTKGKNKEVVKELLGPERFARLENLMKTTGKLQSSLDKFVNTSQTAVAAADVAAMLKVVKDIFQLGAGNPWPLIKTGATGLTVRSFSKLISDKEFLKHLEEAVKANRTDNKSLLVKAWKNVSYDIKRSIPPAVKSAEQSDASN